MMKPTYLSESINIISYVLTVAQTNEMFAFIQLGLNILTTLVLLAFRIWAWVKEAKQDGKITKDEIEEGAEIIGDALEEVKDHLDGEETKKEEGADDGKVH